MTVLERDDIQGNVLRGYNFPCARYLVARVRGDREAPRRRAGGSRRRPTRSRPTPSGPSGRAWPATSRSPTPASPRSGSPRGLLASFPRDFREGMAARADLIGDVGGDAPEHWEQGLRPGDDPRPRHALGRRPGARSRARRPASAATWPRTASTPASSRRRPSSASDREHFGFTDGFGQPSIAGVVRHEIAGQGVAVRRRPWHRLRRDLVPCATDGRVAWRAAAAGRVRARLRRRGRRPPPAPAPPLRRNGTFMVWRKLHQDVAAFRAFVAGARPQHRARDGPRRREGHRPLAGRQPARAAPPRRRHRARRRTASGSTTSPTAPTRRASRARAAPTSAGPTRATPCGRRGRLTARHRILRRGLPYGPRLEEGAEDDGADRGLVFVALQASIERQFEIVQAHGSTTATRSASAGTPDPVAGTVGAPARQAFGGRPPRYATAMRGFVTPPGRRVPLRPRHLRPPSLRDAVSATTAAREQCSSRRHAPGSERTRAHRLRGSDTRKAETMTSREHARRLMLILLSSTRSQDPQDTADDEAARRRRRGRRSSGSGRSGRLHRRGRAERPRSDYRHSILT